MRQRTDPTPSIPKSTETSCVQATRNSWSREELQYASGEVDTCSSIVSETITNNRCVIRERATVQRPYQRENLQQTQCILVHYWLRKQSHLSIGLLGICLPSGHVALMLGKRLKEHVAGVS